MKTGKKRPRTSPKIIFMTDADTQTQMLFDCTTNNLINSRKTVVTWQVEKDK